MIEAIPAIDIMDGRCVRLSKGDYAARTTYGRSPAEWARTYAGCGARRLHLVDLDGARASEPRNLKVLEEIASLDILEVEWGGGIKTDGALQSVLDAGAGLAVVGSVAARKPELMLEWLGRLGPRIILGADVRDGKVAVNGWTEDAGIAPEELIRMFLPAGLEQVIVTDISRDGMLQGPSFELYGSLRKSFPELKIIASGGVSCAADIRKAGELGLAGIITGKAIYEGKISLEELSECLQRG